MWLLLGGHVWLLGGACVVAPGGGGHAWFLPGGMRGFCRGGGVHRIRRDTVNERAVRILLECILIIIVASVLLTCFTVLIDNLCYYFVDRFEITSDISAAGSSYQIQASSSSPREKLH